MELSLIQNITILALPILFAVTLHEVAHGWVASFCGDQTARLSGRLSLNPIRHIDLIGTIIVPLLLMLMSNFIFGWAKPVPVDARNMRHPRRDMAIVALAGPLSNIIMAFLWGCIAKIGIMIDGGDGWFGKPLVLMGAAGIQINVMLAVLNLIPLPPLDGGRVLTGILPRRAAYAFSQIEPYGFIILILLMVTGVLFYIMAPMVFILINLIGGVFGLA